MTDTQTRPVSDFVSTVAKMGHPEIMDIASERLRKLVAMTYITEFTADNSTKFEAVRDEILGIMTENVGDVQKQIQAAREAKQTKIGGDLLVAIKSTIMNAAMAIPDADRPLSFTLVYDYSAPVKNADGSPKMIQTVVDGVTSETPERAPDLDLRVHWTESAKTKSTSGATRTGGYKGRVAGSYTFPDSKNADGTLIEWGSMKKYAETKGYKDADGLPRDYLAKTYDIPNQPTEVNGKPQFVATLKAA